MQTNGQPLPPSINFSSRVLKWLRLTTQITIKVYNGYGYGNQLTVFGSVLKLSPLPRVTYRQKILINTLALIRLFIVKPYPHATVQIDWNGETVTAETDRQGFFKLEWNVATLPQPGWHEVKVSLLKNNQATAVQGTGAIYVPYTTQYGFVSDIDDTFLISHSSNLRKRLYVLFTQNARSRKPFDGTVKHYQLLAKSNTSPEAPNPFFYVSSSEWNLYDYILEFTTVQGIPRGVFLLSQLKRLRQFFKTGQNNHGTKFMRITRILESYPNQQFVLLGDSSQQDPYIYASLVEHFPAQIKAVYIRDIYEQNRAKVTEVLHKIEGAGVPYCFFKHSNEAIAHSQQIGLINVPVNEAAIQNAGQK